MKKEDSFPIDTTLDLQAEAKNLVLDEMEQMGVLALMKAQIKKTVLDILERQKKSVKQKLEFDYMTPLHRQNKSKDVIMVCHLIKEFLQFFEMEYTTPIFEKESNIKESIKRETLLKELNLQENKDDPKPVLMRLIQTYQTEFNGKKNMIENISQKLDDSYGVKYNPNANELTFKNDTESQKKLTGDNLASISSLPNPSSKKQLAPISFINKSVEMKENTNTSYDNNSSSSSSLKFNTGNISEVYKKEEPSPLEILNSKENKNMIKENKAKEEEKEKLKFMSEEYHTNNSNKFDDEFNEVILEEIGNEHKKQGGGEKAFGGEEDFDESKKSYGGNSTSNLNSLGYDSSITNYNLKDFDYVEEAEKP